MACQPIFMSTNVDRFLLRKFVSRSQYADMFQVQLMFIHHLMWVFCQEPPCIHHIALLLWENEPTSIKEIDAPPISWPFLNLLNGCNMIYDI